MLVSAVITFCGRRFSAAFGILTGPGVLLDLVLCMKAEMFLELTKVIGVVSIPLSILSTFLSTSSMKIICMSS